MQDKMTEASKPVVVAIGDNPTSIWGMNGAVRVRRIATAAKLDFGDAPADRRRLLANLAFVFDPPLLRHMAAQADTVLVRDGVPVLANVGPEAATEIAEAMKAGTSLPAGLPLTILVHDDSFSLHNDQLRKREQPFVMRLTPDTVPAIERASYYAAYKGVTDVLTKYLWPEWALVLTRICARLGITPNMVTAVGAALCVLATWLFWKGDYWPGMAAALGFMVLDTVDGKLARCTITSSWWGNIFDHGLDLVHPPFWWWAWGVGLAAWGLAYSTETFALVMAAIVGGYVVQRLIEGIFMRRYGMHIHVWEKADSNFRLITARRNPNMVVLFVALLLGRPDMGLIAVAIWTLLSLIFHAVRLLQAEARRAKGGAITSWLLG
jgi:phosphatidylglycerophosphate synthase